MRKWFWKFTFARPVKGIARWAWNWYEVERARHPGISEKQVTQTALDARYRLLRLSPNKAQIIEERRHDLTTIRDLAYLVAEVELNLRAWIPSSRDEDSPYNLVYAWGIIDEELERLRGPLDPPIKNDGKIVALIKEIATDYLAFAASCPSATKLAAQLREKYNVKEPPFFGEAFMHEYHDLAAEERTDPAVVAGFEIARLAVTFFFVGRLSDAEIWEDTGGAISRVRKQIQEIRPFCSAVYLRLKTPNLHTCPKCRKQVALPAFPAQTDWVCPHCQTRFSVAIEEITA